jgi:hypothetical protein
MPLCGGGTALLELSSFPAGCAPSVLGFGTPALAPGMDWPSVVDEPVVVGIVAELPAVEPPTVARFCARASVPVSANAPANANVENFMFCAPLFAV